MNTREINPKISHILVSILMIQVTITAGAYASPVLDGVQMYPGDHVWNVPVDNLPLHPQSANYIMNIGTDAYLHADFGSGLWNGYPIGIPYNTVNGSHPKRTITFSYSSESDPGPYPIPDNPLIEGGSDRHVLILDRDNGILYEIYAAEKQPDGSWHAGSGAIFNLSEYALRPAGWTSADAAGLPILPGLVRYDEVSAGEITHAIRVTAPATRRAYVWPARHYASDVTDPGYPPMGQRFRLKASFDTSGYSFQARVILDALKRYGMILADNGAPWYISGVPDERWDNDVLHTFHGLKGSDFEAVDSSSLMIDPDLGKSKTSAESVNNVGVFRPSTGTFYLDYNRNGRWDGGVTDRAINFGLTGDQPVSGDWNNIGKSCIGVFRNATRTFYLDWNGNGVWNGAGVDRAYNFGLTEDLPVSGDWNTLGRTCIGAFRPSTHTFYLDYNGNGVWDGATTDRAYNFGLTRDLPVSGDWNNIGRTCIGVFRPSTHTFYLDWNGNGVWDGAVADRAYNFGLTGDIPVSGDWNSLGRTCIGVFRPSTHTFYLDWNGNGVWDGVVTDREYNFGLTDDKPVSGIWV